MTIPKNAPMKDKLIAFAERSDAEGGKIFGLTYAEFNYVADNFVAYETMDADRAETMLDIQASKVGPLFLLFCAQASA